LAALYYGLYAVLKEWIFGVATTQVAVLPMFQLFGCEEITRPWKSWYPASADPARIPAYVIRMKVRAKDKIDVAGLVTGVAQILKVWPILKVVSQLVRTRFVVAAAGIYQNNAGGSFYNKAMNRQHETIAVDIQQIWLKPIAVPFKLITRNIRVQDARFEYRHLKFEHASYPNRADPPGHHFGHSSFSLGV